MLTQVSIGYKQFDPAVMLTQVSIRYKHFDPVLTCVRMTVQGDYRVTSVRVTIG